MAKKIIIVGASSGIGKAIAQLELKNGSIGSSFGEARKGIRVYCQGNQQRERQKSSML